MSLFFSIQSGSDFRVYRHLLQDLDSLPGYARDTLELSPAIETVGKALSQYQHLFFLGR
jgi:glucosamine 6-phosphate synthetase-like amidotransferase/phosphosugar isomerase protein